MIEFLLSLVLHLSPALEPFPKPYDCTTDSDCQEQCLARGDSHCDDPFAPEED